MPVGSSANASRDSCAGKGKRNVRKLLCHDQGVSRSKGVSIVEKTELIE